MDKIPKIAWVCLTFAFVIVVGGFLYLQTMHISTVEYYRFLNTLWNAAPIVLGVGTTILAGRAVVQTNGGLDKRIKEGAKAALEEHTGETTGEITRGV